MLNVYERILDDPRSYQLGDITDCAIEEYGHEINSTSVHVNTKGEFYIADGLLVTYEGFKRVYFDRIGSTTNYGSVTLENTEPGLPFEKPGLVLATQFGYRTLGLDVHRTLTL